MVKTEQGCDLMLLHAGSLQPVCRLVVNVANPICPLICFKMPSSAWYSDLHLAVMYGFLSPHLGSPRSRVPQSPP